MDTSQTPFGLPRAAHPNLSPTPYPAGEPAMVATGPFKVYSPDATDWTLGIDLCTGPEGVTFTTAGGTQSFAADHFTAEMSPDGMIVWLLGDRVETPAVTVLMPATTDDLRTRLPGVEFADLDEAARIFHRLTAASAAGRHTRHRFGLHQAGDMGLVIDPQDGEPVLALLRLTETGMEFRGGGRWTADSATKRIAPFTALSPVTRGAVARFDHLERSPSMSLSLFRRFVIPGRLPAENRSPGTTSEDLAARHVPTA